MKTLLTLHTIIPEAEATPQPVPPGPFQQITVSRVPLASLAALRDALQRAMLTPSAEVALTVRWGPEADTQSGVNLRVTVTLEQAHV